MAKQTNKKSVASTNIEATDNKAVEGTTPKENDNSKEVGFDANEIKETIERAIELSIETKGLSLEEVADAIVAKEEAIEEAKEQQIAKEKEAEEALKNSLKNAFEFDGKFYGLSKRCPKTLRVLDTVYTQEELVKNKEAMQFLIVGNSCFINRLK